MSDNQGMRDIRNYVTIVPCSCRCGGSQAWMTRDTPLRAWRMYGCVCHHEPPPRVLDLFSER